MWWSEFEKRLTRAFNAYVKREGRIVHSDSMKIRMLIDKIKADFLTPTKAQLEIELSRTPLTITYEQSLALFRNMVNQKHPPQMNAANSRTRRQVNEVSTGTSVEPLLSSLHVTFVLRIPSLGRIPQQIQRQRTSATPMLTRAALGLTS